MNYIKGIILGFATAFLFGIVAATDVSAQRRVVVRPSPRPVAVRRIYYRPYYDLFWHGTLWDPYYGWGYEPYFFDPYLRAQRDKYYKEKAVRDARRGLAKSKEKYAADGYLTPKEREKLAKKQQKYAKAVRSLAKFNSNY